MATIPAHHIRNGYPTASKWPVPESDWHRDLMAILIQMLRAFFAEQQVYVSGNLLVFYEEGNKRRRISPDVFVVRGVESHNRPNYLIWEEERSPEVVIELTSSRTRRSDLGRKFTLYQDTLQVREYFLFDPFADYLDPPLQGYRLRKGIYQPIRPRWQRLPSQVLGLHLECDGRMLRLWNPARKAWLLTLAERIEQAEQRADQEAQARVQAEQHGAQAQQGYDNFTREIKNLAHLMQIERLRQQLPPASQE